MSTRKLAGGLLVCSLLLAIWMPAFIRDVAKQAASVDWPSASGAVIQSEPYTRKLLSTGLRFRYEFVVAGKKFESGERRVVDLSLYYTFDSDTAFAAAHPVGSLLTVHYDPANPIRTTLSPGLSFLDFLFAGPLIPVLGLAIYRSATELMRRARGSIATNP
jgi:hypothetical protein